MDTTNLLLCILTGGLLGILGQGIRTIVGIKKLQDNNDLKLAQGEQGTSAKGTRIVYSLFIGFIAGGLGSLVESKNGAITWSNDTIVMLVAIGYSGADFIEGALKNYLPPANSPQSKADSKTQTPGKPSS